MAGAPKLAIWDSDVFRLRQGTKVYEVPRARGGGEQSSKVHKRKSEKTPMSTPSNNGVESNFPPARHRATIGPTPKNRIGLAGLIAEAQALRDAARDTFGRAGRLLVALKRLPQQSRLEATTLASLKQLKTIDG